VRVENLARHIDRFEDLIAEAAQVALKNGLTTVFDTWGPRRHLVAVRDQIAAGQRPGSRIFCAGNIIGMDGPFSPDFFAKVESVAVRPFVSRINALWVENVGRHLMWLTPEKVAEEARAYLRRGIDFLKYASNDHYPGAFIAFSPRVQQKLVEVAHEAGVTAQAHTMSVEGLRMALEAGCDLIQHANNSGPVPIPESTVELFARQGAAAVIFPYSAQWLDRLTSVDSSKDPQSWRVTDVNARNLIRSGVSLLLGNDAGIYSPDALSTPLFARILTPDLEAQGVPFDLATGHFHWLSAMEEKGCPPMQMLRAATCNIARAYGKEELGTLQPGKVADMLILERDPLRSAANYRSIHTIVKDGTIVDAGALPTLPVLTASAPTRCEEEARYKPFFAGSKLPGCPTCMMSDAEN
jgi:imidazolonepropionase-like amidohydrolase